MHFTAVTRSTFLEEEFKETKIRGLLLGSKHSSFFFCCQSTLTRIEYDYE